MNDLRKLAEEATPGPWYAGLGTVLTPTDEPGRNRVIVHTGITTPRGGRHRGGEDATYIAAASPDVILGLLDRIAELEENQRPSDGYCPAARHHRVESRNAARMLGFNDAEEMEYGPEEVTSDRCTACGFDFAARSSSKVETAAGDSAK